MKMRGKIMAKKEYVSPSVDVCALFAEDVITASGQYTTWEDTDGSRYTVGGFQTGWLG